MGNQNSTKNYLKYIVIFLVAVLLISAAFLLLSLWDSTQGRFSGSGSEYGLILHDGQEYKYNENVETFLVLGLDRFDGAASSDSHESGVQADFLMLLVFNNESKQITAVQINRDAMTRVNKLSIGGTSVVESYTRQIALAYNYVEDDNDKIRCRNTKDSVEYLLSGVRVDHYLSLTMDAVVASCDLLGGVEVTVLDDFAGVDDTLVKGETVTLTGEQALLYVRARYGLTDSTNAARMARQHQYINALYEKIYACLETDADFLITLVDTLDDYVVYDSSDQKMLKFAEKFKSYEFLGIRELEGEFGLGEEFLEFYPDEASVRELVLDLFYLSTEK